MRIIKRSAQVAIIAVAAIFLANLDASVADDPYRAVSQAWNGVSQTCERHGEICATATTLWSGASGAAIAGYKLATGRARIAYLETDSPAVASASGMGRGGGGRYGDGASTLSDLIDRNLRPSSRTTRYEQSNLSSTTDRSCD